MFDHLALSESGFLLDTRSGLTYSCSRTGTFLLRQVIAGKDPADLPALLSGTYEIDTEGARHDVDGDDVQHHLGTRVEIAQPSLGIVCDQGICHLQVLQPPRLGVLKAALDD